MVGVKDLGSGFQGPGSGFRVQGLIQGFRIKVQGSGSKVGEEQLGCEVKQLSVWCRSGPGRGLGGAA